MLRRSSLSRSNIFSKASSVESGYRIDLIRPLGTKCRCTSSMISRFSSRSVLGALMASSPRQPSLGRDDVDHEVESAVRRDVRLLLRAVPEIGRDGEQHAAADLHPGQADGPAFDDLAQAELRRLLREALVERLLPLVDLTEVVGGDGHVRGHRLAVTLLEDGALEVIARLGLRQTAEVEANRVALLDDQLGHLRRGDVGGL